MLRRSSLASLPCTVPALVPDDDLRLPLWEMIADVHTCRINIYGESRSRAFGENCPPLELRGRVSWFIIRAEVISGLILCEQRCFSPPIFFFFSRGTLLIFKGYIPSASRPCSCFCRCAPNEVTAAVDTLWLSSYGFGRFGLYMWCRSSN